MSWVDWIITVNSWVIFFCLFYFIFIDILLKKREVSLEKNLPEEIERRENVLFFFLKNLIGNS